MSSVETSKSDLNQQAPQDSPGHSSVAASASVGAIAGQAPLQPPTRRKSRNREGLEAGKRSTRTLLWIVLAAALVIYGFPFVYLLLTSFKTPIDTIAVPPTILPREWTLENYTSALGRNGVLASMINSVQTAIISTLLSLVLAVPAAYGITRYQTPSGHVFIMAALVTRMVPPVAIGIPLASMMSTAVWPTPRSLWPSRTPRSRFLSRSG